MKEEEAWMEAQMAGVARRTAELVDLPSPSTPLPWNVGLLASVEFFFLQVLSPVV